VGRGAGRSRGGAGRLPQAVGGEEAGRIEVPLVDELQLGAQTSQQILRTFPAPLVTEELRGHRTPPYDVLSLAEHAAQRPDKRAAGDIKVVRPPEYLGQPIHRLEPSGRRQVNRYDASYR
jgi:hypothetical protein